MKRLQVAFLLSIGILSINSCAMRTNPQTSVEEQQELEVTGEITAIENGTDGYTATLEDSAGKIYYTTISIVNLSKHGSQYKSHKTGDKITVKGPIWKDTEGNIHITAYQLSQVD